MTRSLIALMGITLFLTGCDQLSQKDKCLTDKDGKALLQAANEAITKAMQAQASVATDEFKKLGTQVYIGEGDDEMLLTIAKDKDGKHRHSYDYDRTILKEAAKIVEEVEKWKEEQRQKEATSSSRINDPRLGLPPVPSL